MRVSAHGVDRHRFREEHREVVVFIVRVVSTVSCVTGEFAGCFWIRDCVLVAIVHGAGVGAGMSAIMM